jgi:DNA-binding CsgD family transcriptional regulator/PAS domain-containing protein
MRRRNWSRVLSVFISAERLSALVGMIYDAAIDPTRWLAAMEAICAELSFHNSTLNLQALPSMAMLTNVASNVPSEYLRVMERPDAGADVLEIWGGVANLLSLSMDRPAVLTAVNPDFDPTTTRNRYFLDFAKPQSIVDVLSVGLARDARALGTIAFGRHETAGPIGERELAVMTLLIPHLQRAATINRMLDMAALEQASFASTLDALATAVVLVGAERQILYANPVAQRMLDGGEPICSSNGMLAGTTNGATRALAVAISHAAGDEGEIGRRGLGIPLRDRDGTSGVLHVLPLGAGRMEFRADAVAAVFVTDIATPFVAPTEMVAGLFGLTPAEARVFALIVARHTVVQAAVALGIERSTVKTHLLRLYDKIGVRRQSELVQVAASLAPPVAPAPFATSGSMVESPPNDTPKAVPDWPAR